MLGQRFGAISLIGKSGEDRKNHENQVPGSLGPWVSWSLGLWASGPLGLWFSGSLGLRASWSLGLWVSGRLGFFSGYFGKFSRFSLNDFRKILLFGKDPAVDTM